MRIRSKEWAKLAARGEFSCESRLIIGDKIYNEITAPIIDRTMMSTPLSIGRSVSATLKVTAMTEDEIDTSLPIVVEARITDGKTYSEYLEFGTFFVDQLTDMGDNLIDLVCYDAMLKTEQVYPMPATMSVDAQTAVKYIADAIGVELDERSVIFNNVSVYWGDTRNANSFTMRQVLEAIAAASGGNWVITEENKLRLISLITPPNETFDIVDADYQAIRTNDGSRLIYQSTNLERPVETPVLNNFESIGMLNQSLGLMPQYLGNTVITMFVKGWIYADMKASYSTLNDDNYDSSRGVFTDFEDNVRYAKRMSGELVNIPVVTGELTTGKNLVVSGLSYKNTYTNTENAYGNNTGYTVVASASMPITNARFDKLNQALEGLSYVPYEATGSCFDPAAELGDWVKIGDIRSVIYNMKISLDTDFRCDLSAPSDNAVESLYPYNKAAAQTSLQTNASYAGVTISPNDGLNVTTSSDSQITAAATLNNGDISFNIITTETTTEIDENGNEITSVNTNTKQCIYYDESVQAFRISNGVVIDAIKASGWQKADYNSNFKTYSTIDSNALVYRKIGNDVEIRGIVTPTNDLVLNSNSDSFVIGTIPIECAPTEYIRELCQGSSLAIGLISITPNGEITISRYRQGDALKNLTANTWIVIHIRYFIG